MSALQRNWDARAAANFMLGGAGSGLFVAAALFSPSPRASALLSLALVALGLLAVWLEIGRKLRAAHVFFNPFTSWMARESLAAALLFLLGAAFVLSDQPALLYGAAAAAAAFLWCQARILRAAKGIPAWRAPEVVPLIVATGLAEGAGLALLFDAGEAMRTLLALALVVRILAWRRYRAAARSKALEPAGAALLWAGGALPLFLLLAASLPWAAPLAGLAALAAGWHFKFALVTRAALKQGFALPRLPVRGAR